MAKRFTATEKWLDPWFCNLGIIDRLFWIYLCDNCDHSGIWQVNFLLVKTYFPGYEPNPEIFGDRLRILTPEKWLLTKFTEFQYGTLNPDNRMHKSVISKLQKEGAYKGLVSPLEGAKDKDKEQDKGKEGVKKLEEGTGETKLMEWFEKLWPEYPQKGRMGKKLAFRYFASSVKTLEDAKRCARSMERYLESKRVKEGFIQNATTWFNNWQDWENYTEAKDGTVNS